MKIAKRFELFPAVASDPRAKIKTRSKEVPLMVAVVLDWDRVILTREIKHHETVFIDDRIHDWDFDKEAGELCYYSHALPSAMMAESCGYLHDMDFNRKAWGTKWNACDQWHDVEQGKARFDTAWSSPEPVLVALSKRFPEEEIHVRYADEDMGCNCGEYTMKNGEFLKSDFAPSYRDQTPEDKEKWRRFACDVRGRDYDEYYGEDGE